jgi:5-methyltetrahydrofolate--homocysteine methyltransferase
MMETVLTSPTRVVKIGPEQPFVIIGERINPTGRKKLAIEMAAWDFERVRADALAQVQAGAQMLDVNAGIPLADEPAILAEAIRIVQELVEVPLCIDSSVMAALEAGLKAYQRQGADQLGNGGGGAAGDGAAAGEGIWSSRDRHFE